MFYFPMLECFSQTKVSAWCSRCELYKLENNKEHKEIRLQCANIGTNVSEKIRFRSGSTDKSWEEIRTPSLVSIQVALKTNNVINIKFSLLANLVVAIAE